MGRFLRLPTRAREKVIEKAIKATEKASPEQLIKMLNHLVRMLGKDAARVQIAKSIEQDFRDSLKKNPSVTADCLVKDFIASGVPEMWDAIKELGLDEDSLLVMANEAKGNKGQA